VNTVPDFFINLQPLEKSPVNENTKPFPDPNSAAVANIFDSHCHLDRVYRFWAQRYKTFFFRNLRMLAISKCLSLARLLSLASLGLQVRLL
jgi:hypothetical protein